MEKPGQGVPDFANGLETAKKSNKNGLPMWKPV
jgi:hypothetical protein